MVLCKVSMKAGANIFVLAENESHAIYRAYNKAVAKIDSEPSNEGFAKWQQEIEGVKELYKEELDPNSFNLY